MLNSSYQERNKWIEIIVALWAVSYYLLTVSEIEGGISAELSYFLPFIVKVIVGSIVLAAVLAILNRCFSAEPRESAD